MALIDAMHVLPTFIAVVEHGGIRKAAEKLALTHGAVSQQIQLLEMAVGQVLFVRQHRRMQLNSSGQSLYELSQRWIAESTLWEKQQRQLRGRQIHQLKLTVLPSFAQHVLLPILPQFQQVNPHISIELDSSIDVRDLQTGEYDAAIRFGNGDWPGMQQIKLMDDALLPACAEHYAELPTEPWRSHAVLQHSAQPWARWLQQHRSDCEPNIAAEFADAGLLLTAVEQGLGIGLVRQVLAHRSLQQRKIRPLGPRYASAQRYYFVWSPQRDQHPALMRFKSWLQQQCERLAREIFS